MENTSQKILKIIGLVLVTLGLVIAVSSVIYLFGAKFSLGAVTGASALLYQRFSNPTIGLWLTSIIYSPLLLIIGGLVLWLTKEKNLQTLGLICILISIYPIILDFVVLR